MPRLARVTKKRGGLTQIDGRRVQRVNRVGKIDAKAVVAIQLARTPDQRHRQFFPDAPVAPLVGIGQRSAFDRATKAHAVQLRSVGQQTSLDVSQTFAVSQLRKGHGAELFRASQTAHAGIAAITCHDSRKTAPRYKLHDLCKQRLACIHSAPQKIQFLEVT